MATKGGGGEGVRNPHPPSFPYKPAPAHGGGCLIGQSVRLLCLGIIQWALIWTDLGLGARLWVGAFEHGLWVGVGAY